MSFSSINFFGIEKSGSSSIFWHPITWSTSNETNRSSPGITTRLCQLHSLDSLSLLRLDKSPRSFIATQSETLSTSNNLKSSPWITKSLLQFSIHNFFKFYSIDRLGNCTKDSHELTSSSFKGVNPVHTGICPSCLQSCNLSFFNSCNNDRLVTSLLLRTQICLISSMTSILWVQEFYEVGSNTSASVVLCCTTKIDQGSISIGTQAEMSNISNDTNPVSAGICWSLPQPLSFSCFNSFNQVVPSSSTKKYLVSLVLPVLRVQVYVGNGQSSAFLTYDERSRNISIAPQPEISNISNDVNLVTSLICRSR